MTSSTRLLSHGCVVLDLRIAVEKLVPSVSVMDEESGTGEREDCYGKRGAQSKKSSG
ncbi:MAG TPA: hypothetical protein VFU08_02535 [Candidatus Udaeobacter sp.]|nr:hypothetical protein [Candidatus Udaeobacter sp.]